MKDETLERLTQDSNVFTLTPGVYIMKNKSGHIIYIGKAKALKNRVSQYFWRFQHHEGKVRKMVENVDHFEYILTDSEFEALVLECSLIKQHQPKYNILLKDDKGYSYIRISLNEKWPRVESAKRVAEDGALYLGPYISSFAVKETVDQAVRAFGLPVCSRQFPRDIGKERPCLNYDMKQCCAPCRGKMTNAEYRELVDNAVTFIKGGYQLILNDLQEKMGTYSDALEFEKAARTRDRIAAIQKIRERQKVVASKVEEQDVIALAGDGCNTDVEIFLIRGGRLCDRSSFLLDYMQDEAAVRAEVIRNYYSQLKKAPRRITLDGPVEDQGLLEQYLSKLAGKSVSITIPQRGEQAALAAMVKNNASEKLNHLRKRPDHNEKTLDELGALLGMEKRPAYIESYDISHTAGSEVVAGMVVFENGKPLKSAYRRFAIKTVEGQDDYACMKEVLSRRLTRLKEAIDSDKQSAQGFGHIPDLILLDGGRGHVSVVRTVLDQFGIDIPLFGMVKDDKHRTRAIARDGGEIAVNANRSVFTLVSNIQEEVHRYAIAYHHKMHQKKSFSSRLTLAPGIGQTRARALMRYFGTMEKLHAATKEELAAVPGMNQTAASVLRDMMDQGDLI